MKIGVLALQGGFQEHAKVLRTLGVADVLVRTAIDLEQCSGLIIPGGESTVINKLIFPEVNAWIKSGKPYLGTCAGSIIFANAKPGQLILERNAFGSHAASSVQAITFLNKEMPGVFIRAPRFLKHAGSVIASITDGVDQGLAVALQFDKQIVISFHPELTNSFAVHEYFLGLVYG